MLNKDNYVSWSSRLLRYAKSKPNEKLLVNSIKNGPYVRRMIHELGDPNSVPPIAKSTLDQTYDELIEKETAKKIWLCVEQMMTGSTIGAQEKKAKLFNEWERFRSSEGESIESYYNRFSKLMNDFYREKHFPEKISSNLKFLNKGSYVGKIARNHNGYSTIQNVQNQVFQNPSIQNVANQNRLIVVLWIPNQNANKTGNVEPRRRDAAHLHIQLRIAHTKEASIQLQAEIFDLMAAAWDIKKVNANCILMTNL
nr:hypothetical protein [Tanacetum cinerariifolium]